jgi:hypothetical protein
MGIQMVTVIIKSKIFKDGKSYAFRVQKSLVDTGILKADGITIYAFQLLEETQFRNDSSNNKLTSQNQSSAKLTGQFGDNLTFPSWQEDFNEIIESYISKMLLLTTINKERAKLQGSVVPLENDKMRNLLKKIKDRELQKVEQQT